MLSLETLFHFNTLRHTALISCRCLLALTRDSFCFRSGARAVLIQSALNKRGNKVSVLWLLEVDLIGNIASGREPWRQPTRPWVRLGGLGASPVAGGAYISFCIFEHYGTMARRGGQTGADHFSSKPRLVLPTVPQIGRGGRRNAFKLQQWAIGGPLTRNKPALAPNRQKIAGIGLADPRLPIVVVQIENTSDPHVSSIQ
jgi:hypothetical protein